MNRTFKCVRQVSTRGVFVLVDVKNDVYLLFNRKGEFVHSIFPTGVRIDSEKLFSVQFDPESGSLAAMYFVWKGKLRVIKYDAEKDETIQSDVDEVNKVLSGDAVINLNSNTRHTVVETFNTLFTIGLDGKVRQYDLNPQVRAIDVANPEMIPSYLTSGRKIAAPELDSFSDSYIKTRDGDYYLKSIYLTVGRGNPELNHTLVFNLDEEADNLLVSDVQTNKTRIRVLAASEDGTSIATTSFKGRDIQHFLMDGGSPKKFASFRRGINKSDICSLSFDETLDYLSSASTDSTTIHNFSLLDIDEDSKKNKDMDIRFKVPVEDSKGWKRKSKVVQINDPFLITVVTTEFAVYYKKQNMIPGKIIKEPVQKVLVRYSSMETVDRLSQVKIDTGRPVASDYF